MNKCFFIQYSKSIVNYPFFLCAEQLQVTNSLASVRPAQRLRLASVRLAQRLCYRTSPIYFFARNAAGPIYYLPRITGRHQSLFPKETQLDLQPPTIKR
jgi:hypothetical protein